MSIALETTEGKAMHGQVRILAVHYSAPPDSLDDIPIDSTVPLSGLTVQVNQEDDNIFWTIEQPVTGPSSGWIIYNVKNADFCLVFEYAIDDRQKQIRMSQAMGPLTLPQINQFSSQLTKDFYEARGGDKKQQILKVLDQLDRLKVNYEMQLENKERPTVRTTQRIHLGGRPKVNSDE